MIVVSDTSPIVNLAAVGLLDLLPALFGRILVPPSVYQEIVVQGAGLPGSHEIQHAQWVEVLACSDQQLLDDIKAEKDIHAGEAEAICLAIELQADALLLDDAAGRALARAHHLAFIGVLGILLKAKQKGLVPRVSPIMVRLQSEVGFYIHDRLFREVLSLAGE